MKYQFSPSLMCMDLTKFNEQISILNSRADMYHVDIMDGHFVKNITLSPFFISQLRMMTDLPIDAHLMVEKPEDFIDMTAESGADYISVHAETINRNAFRLIRKIKDYGAKVGIVLNPATPLDWISPYVHLIDKLTIMTVDPGFAGQPFIAEMTEKIRDAKKIRETNHYTYVIEVDGSCNEKTFRTLAEAGNDIFIIGNSGLFDLDENTEIAWDKMKNIFQQQTNTADIGHPE
ncbi:D-allulose 6-phosphate 3-epimerase [Bacillus atrophaeus]|uniref:D-allulose 6-phosphate 3-epimerase n=1 Tax=Bacillus atrophaeus TaxID=1452 RepID=UPI00227F6E57|nr:D-allulose 6-phosphate 3-epimerase [Bacillus atrophaeus]MCY8513145.1 D-allulose 6-phosphate 3-epimerase [Bacillus atrophaeus]MCY8992268.1 D-allulose 6-phosphate 3-epimerase [Bacillus atrophaeus]